MKCRICEKEFKESECWVECNECNNKETYYTRFIEKIFKGRKLDEKEMDTK